MDLLITEVMREVLDACLHEPTPDTEVVRQLLAAGFTRTAPSTYVRHDPDTTTTMYHVGQSQWEGVRCFRVPVREIQINLEPVTL
jgi:hypothetical protein